MNVAFHPPSATHAEVSAWYDTHGLPRPKFDPQTLPPPRRREARAWHDFDGGECRRGCRGWDGRSERCDCVNNRVCWDEMDGHRYATTC